MAISSINAIPWNLKLENLTHYNMQPSDIRTFRLLKRTAIVYLLMLYLDRPVGESEIARLLEAIKFVWASTFFQGAQRYIRTVHRDPRDEKKMRLWCCQLNSLLNISAVESKRT